MLDTPVKAQGSHHGQAGQRAVPALLLCLALAACGGPEKPVGVVGHVTGFAGMVAADEPRAALVGRDILSSGGSPADAAVAMAFTMAVTLPSQVGLGGGGVCMVYDHPGGKTEVIDFISPAPARLDPGTTRPTALPTLPRGLYALSAKYGKLRWEALLGPADSLARLGSPVSRALAQQLAPLAGPLFEDAEARRLFARPDGQPLAEGDILVQPDLGATLSRLRSRGVGEFYSGSLAHDLVDAVHAAGGSISYEALRDYAPRWMAPLAIPYGDDIAYFPQPPATGGLLEAQLWSILAHDGAYGHASAAQRPHLLAETFARAFADRRDWLNPEATISQDSDILLSRAHLAQLMAGYNGGGHQATGGDAPADVAAGASLAVLGQDGSAVSCAFSLNNPFGIGRVAPHTGIVLAAAPGVKGRGPYDLGPMLAINPHSNEFRLAATASGGTAAPTALIQAALRSQIDGDDAPDALAPPRLHAQNAPDAVFVEAADKIGGELQRRGHSLSETAIPARVNLLQCGSGSPRASRCSAATDPRGYGLALTAGD